MAFDKKYNGGTLWTGSLSCYEYYIIPICEKVNSRAASIDSMKRQMRL